MMYIDDLNFSTRTRNALKRAGIFETSQLLSVSLETLSEKKGFGRQSLNEVSAAIEKLKQDVPIDSVKVPSTYSVNDKYSVVRVLCHIPNSVVIESIKFREWKNAQWVDDLPIASLSRSITPAIIDCLINLKIETAAELAAIPEEIIRKIPRIGSAAIQRLSIFFNTNVKLELVDEAKRVKAELRKLSDQINEKGTIFNELPVIIEKEIAATPELYQDKDIANNIWKRPNILMYIISCLEHQVFLSNVWLSRDDIISLLPTIIYQNINLDSIFQALSRSMNIDCSNDMYRGHKPTLEEWIEKLDDETQGVIRMRLNDATFSEIADAYNCSRERVRQIIDRALNRCPTLREDDNSYWYTHYSIPSDCFLNVWGISEAVYMYYRLRYKIGIMSIYELFEDPLLTTELSDKLKAYILSNKILIENEYVERDRESIMHALGKKYCYELSVSIEKLYHCYNDCLDSNKVSQEDKLRFISLRAFKNFIKAKYYFSFFDSDRVRYFDQITEHYILLLSELQLERYYDVEISTLLLFQDHPKVMKEYTIQNEYELYEVIKKYSEYINESVDCESQITVGEPPLILFGEADRDQQVKRLLFELAPISKEKFCKKYEQRFGVKSRIVRDYYTNSIENYNQDGVYILSDNGLTDAEKQYLTRALKAEFFFIDDIKRRFADRFGDKNLYKINSQTLSEFGYKCYSTYAINSKYHSTSREYFLYRFSTRGAMQGLYIGDYDSCVIVDLSKEKDILNSISVARSALNELTSQLILIQIGTYRYIRDSELERFISIDSLTDWINSIPSYAPNEFFTVKSLVNNGIHNPFEILGYKELQMQYLIKNSKEYAYFKVDDAYVFCIGKNKITLLDFIVNSMKNVSWIKVNDLIYDIYKSYGVKLSREMIMNAIKDDVIAFDETKDILTLE